MIGVTLPALRRIMIPRTYRGKMCRGLHCTCRVIAGSNHLREDGVAGRGRMRRAVIAWCREGPRCNTIDEAFIYHRIGVKRWIGLRNGNRRGARVVEMLEWHAAWR